MIPSEAAADTGTESGPNLGNRRTSCLGLDRQGWIQATGGLVIGLIALFSSYDHINLPKAAIAINQQWGVWFIAASLAVIVVDAQLATGSRIRATHESAQERNRAAEERSRSDQERSRSDQERNRANQERNRAAEARERQAEEAQRQGQDIALLRGAALLTARVQLDPSEPNRSRLNAYLTLLASASDLS